MEPEEPKRPDTFAFTVKTLDGDLTKLILQQMIELRATVEASSVIAIEAFAAISGEDAVEIAKRHDELRQNFLLKHAFRLQDNVPEPPER